LKDKKVKPASWFEIILLYTLLTLLFVYFIPNDSPLSIFTYLFGFTFVAVAPGYCLVSLLFREGQLDIVEKTVLSVALSFGIAGLSGLFLGLSAIGMTTASLTISLSVIVVVLALLAFIRKRKAQSMKQPTNVTIEESA
jgi:uncharacterized membrane protein